MDVVAILILGAGTLFVRVGMAWYAVGLSRSKNAAGAVLRQVYDLCLAVLAFWAIGAALFEARSGFLGIQTDLLFDWKGEFGRATFFNLVLVLIATGIVPGVLSERTKFWPVGIISALLAGIIVPIAAQWIWSGWLARYGVVDVGGTTVLHMTAGLTAAVGAMAVGPRTGKYNRDGSSNFIPGHSIPLASIGVIVILVAWVFYLTGAMLPYVEPTPLPAGLTSATGSFHMTLSAATSRTPMNVLLAAAAGGAVALVLTQLRYGKPDIFLVYAGLLGALVAISAGAGRISSFGAVIIGAGAGLLVPISTVKLDLNWKIDDPTGAVAVHVIGGLWGMLATAFVLDVTWAGAIQQLGRQALSVAVVSVLALVLSGVAFALLKATVGLRAREADEYDGLDLAEHDVNAYPDFQQTMIKSYHLREA